MKTLVLLLVLSVAASFSSAASDGPEFRIFGLDRCSDHACFDIQYSYPGEGRKVVNCTVKVTVTYNRNSSKADKRETFTFSRSVGSSGSGWAYFEGKSALDNKPIEVARIEGNPTCSS